MDRSGLQKGTEGRTRSTTVLDGIDIIERNKMSKFAELRGEEEWPEWLQVDRFGSILFREDHGLRRISQCDAYKP